MDTKKRGFLVLTASGIEHTPEIVNAAYRPPEDKQEATMTEYGHMELARIEPLRAGLPAFSVRIGHDNHEEVNVDLEDGEDERKAFAMGKPGYIGHKAEDLKTEPRSYRLHIEVPSVGHVYTGTLTLKRLGLGVQILAEAHADAFMDAVAIENGDNLKED